MTNNALTLDQLQAISGGINRQPHPNMPKTNWMKTSKNNGSAVESLFSNSNLMIGPISGEGVFAQPDGLSATASVIVGDNHF